MRSTSLLRTYSSPVSFFVIFVKVTRSPKKFSSIVFLKTDDGLAAGASNGFYYFSANEDCLAIPTPPSRGLSSPYV
jgi:hypothetical protein